MVLRFLDEGLASAEAKNMTRRMGPGYADGLVERTEPDDLARHYTASKIICQITRLARYFPVWRASVAAAAETP